MNNIFRALSLVIGLLLASPVVAADGVSFKNLKDGDRVTSPVTVQMTVEGMKIGKAGAYTAGEGHLHILIDTPVIPEGQVIPSDEKHLHYGAGQTEATVTLPPGHHSLTLLLADGLHRSYGAKWASTIGIEVK